MVKVHSVLLVAVLTATLAGCGKSETSQPVVETEDTSKKAAVELPAEVLQVEWSTFPVTAENSAVIASAAGGKVELPDGTRVDIPPGALPADTHVKVRRLASEPRGPSATITDVDVGGAQLTADAKLTLPCPPRSPSAAKANERYRVLHFHPGAMEELPATYDAVRHVVEVSSRSFSPTVVFNDGDPGWQPGRPDRSLDDWIRGYDVAPHNPPLEAPYYTQHSSLWCWAAAVQMMLKAYGKNEEIWTFARQNNSAYRGGTMVTGSRPGLQEVTGQFFGGVCNYFTSRGLAVEHFKLPWTNPRELSEYVAEELRGGRPVLIHISGDHVVVAVGFNAGGVFIHDPSGNLPEMAAKLRQGANIFMDANRLACLHIEWKDFYNVCSDSITTRDWVWTLSVKDVPLTGSPVTMTLLPNHLIFEHPNPAHARVPKPNVYFTWDGLVDPGYRFCFWCGDDPDQAGHETKDAGHAHIEPLHATLTDNMYLEVHVSNASAQEKPVSLVVTLGGKEIARSRQPVPIPPRFTNQVVNVVQRLALRSTGLQPRRHDLVIEARVGGRLVDEVRLSVDLGPSQVTDLRVGPIENNKVALSWMPVPEEGIEYLVHRLQGNAGELARQAPVLVGSSRSATFTIPNRGQTPPQYWYSVTARHVQSGLRGPPADFIPATSDVPAMPPDQAAFLRKLTDLRTQFIAKAGDSRAEGDAIRQMRELIASQPAFNDWVATVILGEHTKDIRAPFSGIVAFCGPGTQVLRSFHDQPDNIKRNVVELRLYDYSPGSNEDEKCAQAMKDLRQGDVIRFSGKITLPDFARKFTQGNVETGGAAANQGAGAVMVQLNIGLTALSKE